MIFAPDLAEKILSGEKTQTRRRADGVCECRYQVGNTYAVQPGRGPDKFYGHVWRIVFELVSENEKRAPK